MIWYVFHNSGFPHEQIFSDETVDALSAMEAAKKVHKKLHHDTGEYDYFVVAASDVVKISAEDPKKPLFTVTTKDITKASIK